MENAIIHLWRKPAWSDLLRSYKIILDNQKIGAIRYGKRCTFEVPPGRHVLYVAIDWCSSRLLFLNLQPGEEVRLYCQGLTSLLQMSKWASAPGDYLKLDYEDASSTPPANAQLPKPILVIPAKAQVQKLPEDLANLFDQAQKFPKDLADMLNQALDYENAGRYEESEALYLRGLAGEEEVLGPEDPETAITLWDLGRLYERQEKWEQAQHFLERACAVWEKTALRDLPYPDATFSMGDLAAIYETNSQDVQAESLYQKVVALVEEIQGSEHLDTATALIDLARFYAKRGRYEQARPFYQRILAIDKQARGSLHNDFFRQNLETLRAVMEQDTGEAD